MGGEDFCVVGEQDWTGPSKAVVFKLRCERWIGVGQVKCSRGWGKEKRMEGEENGGKGKKDPPRETVWVEVLRQEIHSENKALYNV